MDCFYEGENMLVINPDECIDCGVCEPVTIGNCFKFFDWKMTIDWN